MLSNFDADKLFEVIPLFHHTPNRMKNLDVEKILIPHFGVIEKDEVKLHLEVQHERALHIAQ